MWKAHADVECLKAYNLTNIPDYAETGLGPRCVATETKPELAVYVRQHKGEVIYRRTDGKKDK